LRAHRTLEGIKLLLLMLARDPGFIVQPTFRGLVSNIFLRFLKIEPKQSPDPRAEPLHFLDPKAEATIVPSNPAFTEARRKRIASFRRPGREETRHLAKSPSVKTFLSDVIFLAIAAAMIIPTPTLIFAYVTNKTVWEILYR
jgi:hypothetical protein